LVTAGGSALLPVAVDRHVGDASRGTSPVHDESIADDQVVCHARESARVELDAQGCYAQSESKHGVDVVELVGRA
jgi:hypothetical protein